MEWREYPKHIVPHAEHGNRDCWGMILPDARGDQVDLRCNECGAVIRTVPAADVDSVLEELQGHVTAAERCPHCGFVNLFPGFQSMLAYTCRRCGEAVGAAKDTIQ